MPAARRPRQHSADRPDSAAAAGASAEAETGEEPEVEVRRSQRRRRTVSAHWSGERIILQVPAMMSSREVARWAEKMTTRLVDQRERTRAASNADRKSVV